jgi:hypothetical protein
MTNATRFAGGVAAIAALACAMFLYTAHPVRGSDHQDSPATVANPAEDITDVFVYQAPDNSSNVVLQMDVWPLITHGQLPTTALDPNVMYQFKIDNTGDGVEKLVLQLQEKCGYVAASQRLRTRKTERNRYELDIRGPDRLSRIWRPFGQRAVERRQGLRRTY